MKSGVNYVSREKVEAVLKEMGFTWVEQSGFLKVERNGLRLYPAKTKNCGRIDLSGFTIEGKGFEVLGEGSSFGQVKCQVDFSEDEATILESLRFALQYMLEHKKPEKPAPRVRATKHDAQPARVETDEDRAKRRKLIEDEAKRQGVPVSAAADV